jgi:hypothetical protein
MSQALRQRITSGGWVGTWRVPARAAEDRVRVAATGRGDAPGLGDQQGVAVARRRASRLSTDRHDPLERYQEHVAATGLMPEARFATWDSEPWEPGRAYAVSVHRCPDQ